MFERLLEKSPRITVNDLVSFAIEFLDEEANKIFLKEAKKISKWHKLP